MIDVVQGCAHSFLIVVLYCMFFHLSHLLFFNVAPIAVSDAVLQFMKSGTSMVVTPLPGGLNSSLLKLPNGVFPYGQTNEKSTIYIRPSYVSLWNRIVQLLKEINNVVVMGTPGIGKTWFLIYAFHQLCLLNCRVIYSSVLNRFQVLREPDGTVKTDQQSIVNALADTSAVHLYDSAKNAASSTVQLSASGCKIIMATSPDLSPHHQWVNEAKKSWKKLYMETWNEQEIKQANDHIYVDKKLDGSLWFSDWKDRFEWFGGVPRQIFVKTSLNEAKQSFMESDIKESNLDDVWLCVGSKLVTQRATSRLLRFEVNAQFEPTLVHWVSVPIARQATLFHLQKKRNAVLDSLSEACASFAPGAVGPVAGNMLEWSAHEYLAAGPTVRIRQLHPIQGAIHSIKLPHYPQQSFVNAAAAGNNVSIHDTIPYRLMLYCALYFHCRKYAISCVC